MRRVVSLTAADHSERDGLAGPTRYAAGAPRRHRLNVPDQTTPAGLSVIASLPQRFTKYLNNLSYDG